MPRININLDEQTFEELKDLAKARERICLKHFEMP